MANLNQCNFIGRVGRDPEIRYMQNGDAVANCSIAITKKWADKENTEWVKLVFFKKLAELVSQYVGKGSLIFVSGELQTRSWEKDGEKKSTTEVICREIQFLSPKKESKPEYEQQDEMLGHSAKDSDEIPF